MVSVAGGGGEAVAEARVQDPLSLTDTTSHDHKARHRTGFLVALSFFLLFFFLSLMPHSSDGQEDQEDRRVILTTGG